MVHPHRRAWRDVPGKYGKWMTVYQRFRRWSEVGVWEAVAATLAQSEGGQGQRPALGVALG